MAICKQRVKKVEKIKDVKKMSKKQNFYLIKYEGRNEYD